MNPGNLKTKVTIREKQVTRDSYGQEQKTWVDLITTWGEILKSKSFETYAQMHPSEHLAYVVKIRDRNSLANLYHQEMQMIIGGDTFKISHWIKQYNEIIFWVER